MHRKKRLQPCESSVPVFSASNDVVKKPAVVGILLARLPDADLADLAGFADVVCDGLDSVKFGDLLLNCFVNTVIPYTPAEEQHGRRGE
jgi:hypothetical protein